MKIRNQSYQFIISKVWNSKIQETPPKKNHLSGWIYFVFLKFLIQKHFVQKINPTYFNSACWYIKY